MAKDRFAANQLTTSVSTILYMTNKTLAEDIF